VTEAKTILQVRVTARASRPSVLRRGEVIHVAVPEPPVQNQANEAVISLLAKTLGLSRSALTLVTGAKGRLKRIVVIGMTRQEAFDRIREA
jgi:uncharacterized protein YggU (UPF0235/DUF167 family)